MGTFEYNARCFAGVCSKSLPSLWMDLAEKQHNKHLLGLLPHSEVYSSYSNRIPQQRTLISAALFLLQSIFCPLLFLVVLVGLILSCPVTLPRFTCACAAKSRGVLSGCRAQGCHTLTEPARLPRPETEKSMEWDFRRGPARARYTYGFSTHIKSHLKYSARC